MLTEFIIIRIYNNSIIVTKSKIVYSLVCLLVYFLLFCLNYFFLVFSRFVLVFGFPFSLFFFTFFFFFFRLKKNSFSSSFFSFLSFCVGAGEVDFFIFF